VELGKRINAALGEKYLCNGLVKAIAAWMRSSRSIKGLSENPWSGGMLKVYVFLICYSVFLGPEGIDYQWGPRTPPIILHVWWGLSDEVSGESGVFCTWNPCGSIKINCACSCLYGFMSK